MENTLPRPANDTEAELDVAARSTAIDIVAACGDLDDPLVAIVRHAMESELPPHYWARVIRIVMTEFEGI